MLEHLNKLSEKELLDFEKFIDSPYFNSVANVRKLFRYLKKFYPEISDEHTDNEHLFFLIYRKKRYDDVKMRKLRSNFRKVFEDFLFQTEMESENSGNRTLLLKALRRKNLTREFELALEEFKKDLYSGKYFSKNDTYYFNRISLLSEEYYGSISKAKHNLSGLLQEKSDTADYLFAFQKLHTFHEMLVHQYEKSGEMNFNKTFFDSVFAFIEKNESIISANHPNLYIIYNVYQMYSKGEKKSIDKFIRYLRINESKFSEHQLAHYYRYLESFYWTKINEGHHEYKKEVFKIYRYMVASNIFVLDEFLLDIEFNNVVNASLPLGKFQWAESFIEEHRKYLKSELANETYNLAKAKLLFYQKDFKRTLEHLNNIHFKDSHYFLNAKFLLARTMFEQKNYESIPFVLSSLNQYTRRGRFFLNLQQKKNVTVSVKYYSLLLKNILSNNRAGLFVLKKQLLNEKKFVAGKEWFTGKIDSLIEEL